MNGISKTCRGEGEGKRALPKTSPNPFSASPEKWLPTGCATMQYRPWAMYK